ncbi:Ribonuclease [Phytophthora megakarya]|uniref:ribonuclease H n=1 Tax=Phytophthora megakarya TaxID=4795 RepID=A0A225UYU5_9STRA|nr:Ribonuclease [Phytophthora megakarya]
MAKGGFYAVAAGRSPGIFTTWSECEAQVKGFTGARYKKFSFSTNAEAQSFMDDYNGKQGSVPKVANPTTKRSREESTVDDDELDQPPAQKLKQESQNLDPDQNLETETSPSATKKSKSKTTT